MRYSLILLLLLSVNPGFSQNVGIGTNTPDPSAQLDVSSNNKGLLPPRMTFDERNAITNPAAGLIIWCSDCLPKGEVQVYNGMEWTNMVGGQASANYVQLPCVTIGTQIWSIRNLDVANYRNGDPIPQVTNPTQWANLTTGAWCWYNNDSSNGIKYGKLYNWYAVNDPRGLAPIGWHLPKDNEWTILVKFLDSNANTNCGMCSQSSIAGGKLKDTGIILWQSPNALATNASGFSGLPGGDRDFDGTFYNIRQSGVWWTDTQLDGASAWNREIVYNSGNINRIYYRKTLGFSVRVVRD